MHREHGGKMKQTKYARNNYKNMQRHKNSLFLSIHEMIKYPTKPYAICIRKPYVHLRSCATKRQWKNRLLYFKWKFTIYNALIWRNAVNKSVPFEIEVIYKSRHLRPQALDTMTIVICTLIVRIVAFVPSTK